MERRHTRRLFPRPKQLKVCGGRGSPRSLLRADGSGREGQVQPDPKVPSSPAESGETMRFWTCWLDGTRQESRGDVSWEEMAVSGPGSSTP